MEASSSSLPTFASQAPDPHAASCKRVPHNANLAGLQKSASFMVKLSPIYWTSNDGENPQD